MVDVFAVDVTCGWGGETGFPAAGVFLLEAVEFEAGLKLIEEAHL